MAPPVVTVELGLGGRFRQRLINELFVAGAWPLAEVSPEATRARDISGNGNHGTYTGDDFIRGIPLGLPEGGLGTTFDGTNEVIVPDDGPNLTNLSLANGSMDIVFLCSTTTNDSVIRGIVMKHNGTNGYKVSLYQGGIEFQLDVAGIAVIAMRRGGGVLDDGELHLVHCCYEPENNRARIFIDGLQQGAEETATTEPAYVATDFKIAGLVPAEGRFIGTLALVMVGREGNPDLSAELQATMEWTDVSEDVVITEPMPMKGGIQGTSEADRMASPGSCTFLLDNSHRNSAATLGYYSIGHPDCRTGFSLHIPARVTVLDADTTGEPYTLFVGSIKKADPMAGENRDRNVTVTCGDWLEIPARQALSVLPAMIDVPSHTVFWTLVDLCDGAPHAVEVIPGGESLAYAGDSSSNQMRILQEMARVAASGQDYGYLRGDGTLVYEPRYLRRNETTADAEYDNEMLDLSAPTDEADIVNIVRGEIVPREVVEDSVEVLWSMTNRQPIDPGDTLVIEGLYKDPNEPSAKMGGTEVVTPVANTDYTMETSIGGNITSDADVTFEDGGSGFRAVIRNDHATEVGYFRFEQIRGQAIRRNESILVEERDEPSIRQNGPRELPSGLQMPYQASVLLARDVARQIIERRKDAKPNPPSLVLGGSTQVQDVLERVIGDNVEIIEEVTGVSDALQGSPLSATRWYIQSKEVVIEQGEILTATFGLTQAPSVLGMALWIVGIAGFSEIGLTTFVAPL